jgi:hypothetical protein
MDRPSGDNGSLLLGLGYPKFMRALQVAMEEKEKKEEEKKPENWRRRRKRRRSFSGCDS